MSYVHPSADLTYIKTVAVVPFENLTQERGAGEKVVNVVAAEVLRRGVFDVVEFGEVTKVLREEGFNEEEGTVTHHLEGSLFPNWVGTDLKRFFEFSGNQLKLSTLPMPMGGQQVTGVLLWERLE